MRGGILIVGSLLWNQFHERDQWRRARLRIDDAVYVKLPIRYGRRSMSRGGTFTMTFALNALPGQGVLVPCSRATEDMAALIEEAEALWKAEDRCASAGSIGASWGCVGVSFRAEPPPGDWLRAWAAHFQAKGCAVSSVSRDGLLRIPWPLTAADGTPVNVDVILGTATKAEATSPTSETIADAWLGQAERHERYFFENVRRGIRTADDGLIWRTIEERKPCWLRDDAYAEAIAILRREAVPAA